MDSTILSVIINSYNAPARLLMTNKNVIDVALWSPLGEIKAYGQVNIWHQTHNHLTDR